MKKTLDLGPISEEQVSKEGIPLSELWLVNLDNSIFGPFSSEQIKNYAPQHEELFQEASLCNMETEQWNELYHWPAFQRRKPQISEAQDFSNTDQIYLHKTGNTEGPYSLDQISEMLKDGEISTTSEISLNHGRSWIKIYNHPEFERRIHGHEMNLPFKPKEDQFLTSNLELIQGNVKNTGDVDALVGLAYLGHKKEKGLKEHSEFDSFKFEQKVEKESFDFSKIFKSKVVNFSAAFLFVIIGFGMFFGGSANNVADLDREPSKRVSRSISSSNTRTKIIKNNKTRNTRNVVKFNRKITRKSPVKRSGSFNKYTRRSARRLPSKPKIKAKSASRFNRRRRTPKRETAAANDDPYRDDHRDEYPENQDEADRVIDELVDDQVPEVDAHQDYEQMNDF